MGYSLPVSKVSGQNDQALVPGNHLFYLIKTVEGHTLQDFFRRSGIGADKITKQPSEMFENPSCNGDSLLRRLFGEGDLQVRKGPISAVFA